MSIILRGARFFTERHAHIFEFAIDAVHHEQLSGVTIPVRVDNVHGGLEAQWDEAHRVLLSVLEEATGEARQMYEKRQARDAAGSPPPSSPENP